MTKLLFNKEKIQNNILPSLGTSISYLEKAISDTDIRIPTSFEYLSYLVNIKSNVRSQLLKLYDLRDWLNISITKVDLTMEELNNDIKLLDDIDIKDKDKWTNII